jgi:hypothetical protein
MSEIAPPYKGLPTLAGLATFEEATRPGLSVEESVKRLKRFHYTLWRVHQIWIAHIPSEPIYELKMAFSLHAHLAAENDTLFRSRIGEMREPPLGLEKPPHPALEMLFDEILCAPTTEASLLGLYEIALPALGEGLRQYLAETHPLADHPSRRLCRIALLDVEDIIAWGHRAVDRLATVAHREEHQHWLALLEVCLTAAGGLDGRDSGSAARAAIDPTRYYSVRPFQYNSEPRRDERFPDPYNMGVNAEVFIYDETMPPEPKPLMLFYKRLREIDVPEMMSSIIAETKGKPWGYYRDMTRQLWDEARHAMMGEVGFISEGIDWPRLVMVNSTWSRFLNSQLTPKERHAVLYFIEQGLMPKTGKRQEWVVSQEAKCPLAITFQDFDWADEVLHARIGRDWYVADMPSTKDAIAYGDQCWSKVLIDWNQWRQDGLTEHRNWWPDLYEAWCRNRGLFPDPGVAAYSESYAHKRADLKEIA